MKKIFLTGSNGFLGQNLIRYLKENYLFTLFKRNGGINICDEEVVVNFAGLAHDTKNKFKSADYYKTNTNFTIDLFDSFLNSNASVFIHISSVKAIADIVNYELTEEQCPNPKTDYGKSKLLVEKYIMSKVIPNDKRVYILRPTLIHGPGNKGNFNLLYKTIKLGIPWPLGCFNNKRSFCSIENFNFILNEFINNTKIPQGVYNICDDYPLSTNDLVCLISKHLHKKIFILNIPKKFVFFLAKIGDFFSFPFNSENLKKLTENYVVSNKKILDAIKKPLPISTKEGIIITLKSFESN
jgi:nucleoside-diphosphate-sugar epimerase